MEVIVFLICAIGVIIATYYVAVFVVKFLTGYSDSEASNVIHNFVRKHIFNDNTSIYSLETDFDYRNKVEEDVKNIIGETRFNQLIDLNKTAMSQYTLSFGDNSGLPYVAISVMYNNDNEKQRLETILCNLTRNYLIMHNCSNQMLVNWKTNTELLLPCLEIRYARTSEEQELIKNTLKISQQKIITVNSPVIDTDDDENLTDDE